MIKTTLKTILGLSLIAGCAGDEEQTPSQESNTTQKRQQGVRSADATARLLSLSNATLGGAPSSASLVEDLAGDVELSLEAYLETLDNAECLQYTLDDSIEDQVIASLDFSGCTDAGGDIITGDFDVTVSLDGDEIDCDFDADIEIDGTSIDGAWTIDINDVGTAVVLGEINISFLDGASVSTLIDASWKDIGGECPVLDQHIEVSDASGAVSVDLGGFDLCEGSFCGSGIDIQISDAEGLAEVDFGGEGVSVEGFGEGFVCDANGNLGWDDNFQDSVDDALDQTDPLDQTNPLDDQEVPGL